MVKLNVLVFSLLGLIGFSVGQFEQDGQCDPTIQLATNFDLNEFLGDWYEIARSANPTQDGHCSSIRFSRASATATTVDINGRMVRENFLQEITGTASQVTGQAKLNVNIPSIGEPFEWSILLTDHQNFALAYSCANINNQRKRVHVWQLGRQTTYPNQMIPALMNTTLGNLLGIDAVLLESVLHTENACRTLPVIGSGQPIILDGQCDTNIRVQQNFDVASFLGLWHEQASYYSESALGTCNRAQYTLGNNRVDVLNSQVVNQTLDTIDGYATVVSTDNSARLSVVLNVPGGTNEMPLYVIATDYTQYAISYTCVNLSNNQRRIYSWIVSRTRTMNESVSLLVNEVVNSVFELNNQYYRTADQSDAGCFFYPEPVPNQPVIFRGQCDQSIPALPNFDPVRYMGLWHDIESYPTEFQFGTCANAFYTLVDGEVDVFNTQVVNQSLDTINGVAVIASTDGSAKLSVSFPIAGTNLTIVTDYWVLNTDYENYAIVYSCRNINSDEMQVTSWKLSRTKSLSNASATAIANTIQNINVLDSRYYQEMDQSVDGCFYYPDPAPGVPVVFPGQCDLNISVQTNFNLTQFAGTWHEVEAYPKEQQTGQCINHQFVVAGANGYNLVSSNVDDQFVSVTSGVVTFSGSTGEGKFTIALPVNGTTINIPYWILSTDYNNYALAYSCININQDFRGIWSWKLSRTRQLTAASNTNINQIIGTVQVLDNVYYENIDQSDDACFYLPEIPPGNPIILPGQCDTNITGIQNFNAAAYLGNWRLIEGYPSDSQTGTCEEANYSLGADGTVVVFNTEVVNQTLVSITGSAVLARDDGSGVLNVVFPDIPGVFEYFILDTDYVSFALVYGCMNINADQRRIWSWKMSRTNSLDQNAINRINQVVNRINVLNNRYYQPVDRSPEGCFYFPEPDANNAVIFPGQCDETIQVVTNFNAAAYLGLWHDIERYPVAFQNGTCGNAFYSLVEEGVDVFNTQVINQTLDTINGIAVLSSDDGTAKLDVTFPIAGAPINVTTKYWVLATDYNNFALVYSCTNIDEERRQVSSWKLGRAKSLSVAANAAMQLAIDRVQVLDNRYYIAQDQTPEGCFYYPEPQPGVPVVFPGQCDATISGIQNFNMANFQGLWHEIEAYPKEDETGQCVNHQFTVQSNTAFNLQSSSITNAYLGITNSIMVFDTNDGSASFNIIISANGSTITIPYKILDTDYNNYAVAYSCVDINADFRAVYSWKLSRTKSLTTASITAINNAISNINVLDNVYFETVGQTDDACFYFPEVVPGQAVEFPGQCDTTIAAVQNFNAAAYLGRWKLIETYPSEFQLGECNDATYTLGANNIVDVLNTEVVNQTLNTIGGTAVVASTDNSGILSVNIDGAPGAIEYYILDTDYTSFTVVYSCLNVGSDRRRVWGWKMSRTDELTPNAITRINAAMEGVNVMDNRYFQTVNRSPEACFYFPEPQIDTPLVFRGQCDENITVVTNFNAAAYLGLWHDVERYPVAFQNGTCGNAFYSLVEEGVDVFNTQVINQSLDTIRGIAVLSSDDGTAKLDVTFPILGTPLNITTNYWVLATDYNNYALVYSCQNLDSEYRQVSSWKLGRAKSLSAAANAAMQVAIDRVQVLDNRYYIPQDQTPDGCFYYPEPQPGVPVVFPGQCDNSVSIVSNFNMAQFQGVWHEIEAYPKDFQPGDCVNHEFTVLTSSMYNLRSTNVLNLTLGITNSNARFATIDSSVASFFIDIPSNGSTITIPYQILNTDYNNYALAYSCMNLNSDFRAIYSWKLSRTKSLTLASITAINNAISNVQVLDNVYFESIDQSNDGCFYLPDLAPGEPVIFPGQCETNVPVMPNFDPARYLGRWRLIETYPSEFQLGDCADATYSLAANGTVIVFNTEVVNETLSSIYGLATIDSNAKLIVTFPDAAPIEYYILDTDYDTYALVYSCSNLENDRRRVWAWKMSRSNELSQTAINNIETVINNFNVLDNRYFESVDRSAEACFYFPEPGTDPIEFRGQCDANITGMPAFDAVRYMGLWHDIESYPAPFQMGTCPNAEYTLNTDGTVTVYNTQVVNQVLDEMIGTAVVASTDGTAWLRVTFNVGGQDVTTDYYVLDTDYVNYALVYSCQNINDEYRRVFSWKLSRAQNLSTASALAIQQTITRIQVLSEDYFLYRGQSESDCFYYPDNFGGDVILPGQCVPDNQVEAVTNFVPSNFAHTWHEVARFPSELQDGECAASNKVMATANTFNITNTFVRNERQFSSVISGSIRAGGRGVIDIAVAGVPFENVYILATDYSEYALMYACRNLDAERKQIFSWKLSNSRSGLSQNANNAINAIVSDNIDLWEGYYYNTQQTEDACFYYPVFEEMPSAIILPGRCNENIRGVSNFDAAAYMGRWIEIQRYPQPDQFGTCDRAEYSLNLPAVDVRNTQVVNQTLLTQLGQGFVASTDGTAQLDVIFDVNGVTVTANYYVLATDYTNFAFVYSCRNLDSGERQVGSWKLSRTTSLSTQANIAMDLVISNTQGLIQEYYLTTSQSDDDCFYIPEVNTIEAPVFRGQCENVSGVQNFDIQRYLGWWHEIERFPINANAGECRSSRYEQSGNQYLVTDTSVSGGNSQVTTGSIQASSNGVLTRTLSDGSVEEIVVLATDYDSYALLYSCVNIDSERRRVWSAKHSKTRQLTNAAQNAMAPYIESNSVLYPQFYLQVNQSDSSCFHYPTQTGQQIILPGQCDLNIPAVLNFDAAQYGGTWYQIERYPQIHEVGNCTGARYTLDSSTGIVDVLNWEVVDGVLDTIEGTATVVSTDGSARLTVVLPIRGTNDTTETPLYVLTTDYTSYSLAYSCVNVNEFERQVGAWKLSRARTMPAAGTTAINAYMQQREELYQPYFIQIQQSDSCEEPSSAFLFKSSLVVILVCIVLQLFL